MNSGFELTPQAIQDLDDIWSYIATDNPAAANRVESEIVITCRRLAKHPLIGTRRQDITHLAVRFWALPRFPHYVVVYRPDTTPLQVIAVLQG